jgi:hypothetical protein
LIFSNVVARLNVRVETLYSQVLPARKIGGKKMLLQENGTFIKIHAK